MNLCEFLKDLLLALVTAAAAWPVAYFAAKYAFKLQVDREKRKEDDDTVASANRAILRLIEARRNILAYAERLRSPHLTPRNQHFAVVPAASPVESLAVNLDSLVFILGSKDPNVLYALSSDIAEINSTIEFINSRDQLHSEFQRRTGDQFFGRDEEIDIRAVEAAAGPFLTRVLRQMTEDMIEHIPEAIKASEGSIERLRAVTKEVFPTHKVALLRTQH